MTQHANYDYLRVRITTTLETVSPLHCGDGTIILADDWGWKSNNKKSEGTINAVCKNKDGRPYIPASTLRGNLRDRYKGMDKKILFGSSHEKNGSAGKIRIYDAIGVKPANISDDQYQHITTNNSLRDGVAIDPVTQTAKEHHLYIHEIVPEKTTFHISIEADRITEEQITHIKQCLQEWNGDIQSAIGKGRSKGWGRIKISESLTIKTLTNDSIKNWVEKNTQELQWDSEEEKLVLSTPKITNTFRFNLYPQSPLLINDHSRVSGDSGEPKQEFMRNIEHKAIIPGSTLKGATRAQAHRIMATIAHMHYDVDAEKASELVEASINALFGAERKRSLLWFNDAIDQCEGKTKPHPQFFNAVDRFTGGVADTALFNVIAANCKKLSGECFYDNHPQRRLSEDWWKGLLLLLIRDFMEGDFSVGWGKGKGYGRALLEVEIDDEHYSNFESLRQNLEKKYNPDSWIKSLHEHIEVLSKAGV